MFENCTVKYLAEKGVNVGVKVTYPKKEDGSTFSKSIPLDNDNTDYQNQYSEFLKKNMIYEEEPTPKEDKPAKRKKKEPKKLEYFMA